MRINLKVEYVDGVTLDVTASLPDLLKFEEKFGISIVKIENDIKLTYLVFLAWASLTRQKQTTLAFDKWSETVEMISVNGDKSPK